MKGFWLAILGLCALGVFAVNCASGDDDDDDAAPDTADDDDDDDGGDDDGGDDDGADDDDDTGDDDDDVDDDADDDTDDDGPTDQECAVIWGACESEYPITENVGLAEICGAEPSKIGEPYPWIEWRLCSAAILSTDYETLDGCGFDQGCEGESHAYYDCMQDYYGDLVVCAQNYDQYGDLIEEMMAYDDCEQAAVDGHWCDEI